MIVEFARAWQEGRFPLEHLMDRRYTLDQVNQALDDLETRRAIRPLLEIDPNP